MPSVRAATLRASTKSRVLTQGRATAAQSSAGLTFKGGNLYARDVSLPDRIAPNGTVPVVVTMQNDASLINPVLDPDSCSAGRFEGYQYTLTVDPEWTSAKSETICQNLNRDTQQTEFEFNAPSSGGLYTVTIEVTLPGSGTTGMVERDVLVEEGAQEQPGDVGPDPGDGGGPGGLLGGSDVQRILYLIVLIAGLSAVSNVAG